MGKGGQDSQQTTPLVLQPATSNLRFRSCNGLDRRAKSIPSHVWDRMWPKIQAQLANGVQQRRVVQEIRNDIEAKGLDFQPSISQLEGEMRKRKQMPRSAPEPTMIHHRQHHDLVDTQPSGDLDTTTVATVGVVWGPSLAPIEDTDISAISPVLHESISSTSAWSQKSSIEELDLGHQRYPLPMQPPRLSEAARGLAKLGFYPEEWRTYLRNHPESFDTDPVDLLNAARQALSLDNEAYALNYLDAMNLLWARRLLSEDAWEAFLESLIRVHASQGNETHMKICKRFVKSGQHCLKKLQGRNEEFPKRDLISGRLLLKLYLPVDLELFTEESLRSFELEF